MKTTRQEQLARVVMGLGVMFVGSFSFVQIAIAGYLFGLLLIGIGLYPKSTEYPENFEKKRDAAPAAASSAKTQKKSPARRRKASAK